MSVPFNRIVSTTSGVIAAAGSGVDLSAMVFSRNELLPTGRATSFNYADTAADYFDSSADEAAFASLYFQGPDNSDTKPGNLLFWRLSDDAAKPAWIRGGAVTDLAAVKAASPGHLTLSISGSPVVSSNINLGSATSFSAVAALVEAAFSGGVVACEYNTQHQAFIITTADTGTDVTMGYASNDLAQALGLREADGATLSGGLDQMTLVESIEAAVSASSEWATVVFLHELTQDEAKPVATWANTNSTRYAYAHWETAATGKTAGSTACFAYWLRDNNMSGTVPHWGNWRYAQLFCSWAASIDFARTEGRSNYCYRTQSGLPAAITDRGEYDALVGNGYNVYAKFGGTNPASNKLLVSSGSTPGKWLWADSLINQVWLLGALQAAAVQLLATRKSIPYTPAGDSLISGVLSGVMDQFVRFGGARAKGDISDASQIAQIEQGGGSVGKIKDQGYYVLIHPATAQQRAARTRSSTVWYFDGQSVQKLAVNSLAVL